MKANSYGWAGTNQTSHPLAANALLIGTYFKGPFTRWRGTTPARHKTASVEHDRYYCPPPKNSPMRPPRSRLREGWDCDPEIFPGKIVRVFDIIADGEPRVLPSLFYCCCAVLLIKVKTSELQQYSSTVVLMSR